jgi:hypothetical protein
MPLERLLLLYPDPGPPWAPAWWVALLGLGVLVGVCGARFSRGLLTLGLVALGAMLGKHIPVLLSLKLDPMAGTVVVAVLFGVVAFGQYRQVLAGCLGWVVGCTVALGVWVQAAHPAEFAWPTGLTTDPLAFATELKAALGGDLVNRILAFASVSALAASAVGMFFPRLGALVLWTLLGVLLTLFGGLGYTAYYSPGLFEKLPLTAQGQFIALGAMAVGFLAVQGWLVRRPAPVNAPAAPAPTAPPAQPATA